MDEHEQIHELAAEAALGVLDPAEQQRMENHLAGCPNCRRDNREFQAVGDTLARSVPPLEASPELRARILATVTARP
ncbi:MAG TPA: zf-HC2 domain-containing protein, partial [Chloroflexota bacterium]